MQFEKGIPIPEPFSKKGRPSKWSGMEVGDSVFFPGKDYKHGYNAAAGAKKRHGFEFVVRSVEGGVRVWRIK